ncbi:MULTISPECIES: hypothetical protein [unclassified Paraburkholderia]|uniref:hypothetical protein n=1 Tax=unclassified Paraburkholderia TaxID=2615204 RepID=UPI00160C6A69|nr:DNA-binding LacI/PurR family transcriptional regulator [Paraburkholderia sp. WSM4177]MBB5483850.1 DNA-binding LacI/PurR family transcriptional regulator [Paraburkholderia sp. WSM4180]
MQRNRLSERGGYLATEALLALDDAPDAPMFQSDCMAIGAYRKLHELGQVPGRDLAIFIASHCGASVGPPRRTNTPRCVLPRNHVRCT